MRKLYFIILAACFLFTSCAMQDNITSGSSEQNSSSSLSVISKLLSSESQSSSSSSASASKPASVSSSDHQSSSAASSSKIISSAPIKVIVSVTIPEGYCVSQIGDLLQTKGVCGKADFLTAVNTYTFTEKCVSGIPYNPDKMCFRLEGYLYPDTYQFYKNMKAQDAIGKMLLNADSHIVGKYSFEEVILASIIEKEVPDAEGMKNASSVFHNRLNNTKVFPFLGSDATVLYLTRYLQSIDNAFNTGYVEKYKYFYNTNNRVRGLPSAPICSPGANALNAAANPNNTDYLYFASDASGNYTFSHTPIGASSSSSLVTSS